MHALPDASLTTAAAIGWFYLITNAMRVFTYLPQIVAVWRSTDGARAVSLLTWGSWLVSNAAAILYGLIVVHDLGFVLISSVNFCGCGCVTLTALQRRRQWQRAQRRSDAPPRRNVASELSQAASPPVQAAAAAGSAEESAPAAGTPPAPANARLAPKSRSHRLDLRAEPAPRTTLNPGRKEAIMKSSDHQRDNDPAKLRTWVVICTLTAAAYAAILLFSPDEALQAQPQAASATAPAAASTPGSSQPSAAPVTAVPAGEPAGTVQPVPMV